MANGQPTYRRWTKYSNLEEKIGRHPLPQMSKLKNVCVICHAVGFDLFCPPVSTLGRKQQLWNLGGAGDKVVQGLNNLSIYCTSITLMTLLLCAPDCSVHALWPPSALCRSYPRVHSTWQERYGKISTFGCFPVAPPLALVPLWATLGCEPGREGLPDHDDQVLSGFSHAFSHPKKVTKR